MKAIILAAGIGSRLGKPYPKPLTMLKTGETILERQVQHLSKLVGEDNIIIVVGFKKDLIMEAFPNQLFIYNNIYDVTNTAKSLLLALRKIKNDDVLWLNGDVVFDENVLSQIIDFKGSCMAVNTYSVADEKVKYNVFEDGSIHQVSKIITNGLGEAVGINKISNDNLNQLIKELENCNDQDYFEKGIEFSIEKGLKIYPIDVSNYLCMEIDFNDDLNSVNEKLGSN